MPITVAQAEEFAVAILGKLLGDAGLSVAIDGENPDLRVPIDEALGRSLDADGVPLLSTTTNAPIDADLARLAAWQARPFKAGVIVETLLLLQARLADVDQRQGTDEQKLSQMGAQIAAMLAVWEPRATVAGVSWFAIGAMASVVDAGLGGLDPTLYEPADGWLIP